MTDDLRKKLEEKFDLSYKDEFELWLAFGVFKRKVRPVMGEILSRFWKDPAYAKALLRAVVGILAGLVTSGYISLPGAWGVLLWKAAQLWPIILAMPAGQTNRPEAEVKAIAHDPDLLPPAIGDTPRP